VRLTRLWELFSFIGFKTLVITKETHFVKNSKEVQKKFQQVFDLLKIFSIYLG